MAKAATKTKAKTKKPAAKKAPEFQALTKRRQETWNHFIYSTKMVLIASAIILGLMAIFLL